MEVDKQLEQANVVMFRQDMIDVPRFALPAGYGVRLYRPGDRAAWARIWGEEQGEHSPGVFDREFGHDLPAMEKRCLFLTAPDGGEVGTVTAWYKQHEAQEWGLIHWVAIASAYRGKGLARGMMTAAMDRLAELGHVRAMLVTQAWREVAIRTYLRLGFQVTDPVMRAYLYGKMQHPALAD